MRTTIGALVLLTLAVAVTGRLNSVTQIEPPAVKAATPADLETVNKARAAAGLKPLQGLSPALDAAAADFARDQWNYRFCLSTRWGKPLDAAAAACTGVLFGERGSDMSTLSDRVVRHISKSGEKFCAGSFQQLTHEQLWVSGTPSLETAYKFWDSGVQRDKIRAADATHMGLATQEEKDTSRTRFVFVMGQACK